MRKSLIEQANIHSEYARSINNEIIQKIQETYKKIANGKKKYMKILKQDIVKERDHLYHKTKKELKKDKEKLSENMDLENLQMSLDVEFETIANESYSFYSNIKRFGFFRI